MISTILAERIREIRKLKNLTAKQVSDIFGTTPSAISNYEQGIRTPDIEFLNKYAAYFGVSIEYLVGNKTFVEQAPTGEDTTKKKTIRIPVLGVIPAGIPIEAIENIVDYEELHPDALKGNRTFFGLRVKGDSMAPEIQSGSTVIVRQQPSCETGDVCVVMVNGQDATLKRVRLDPDGIYLVPSNPIYPTEYFTNEKIKKLPVRILGVVYEVRFSYKKI